MQIAGQFQFDGVSSEALWNFLTDANRIAECLPGCEQLTHAGEIYQMKMSIGIGAVKGTFSGEIRLHDLNPVAQYQMTVSGSGAPGFVKGEGTVRLNSSEDSTLLEYFGDVNAGGPIASVGQRLIGGAARMIISHFFKCVSEKLRS
jgi:carbon monoxide dehydrogenase subunit G